MWPNTSNIPISYLSLLFTDVIGSFSFQGKLSVHFSNLNNKERKPQALYCVFQ